VGRGVPNESSLAEMRATEPLMQYVVGTLKGRLTRLERGLISKPRQQCGHALGECSTVP
jgi:hypothetical protein